MLTAAGAEALWTDLTEGAGYVLRVSADGESWTSTAATQVQVDGATLVVEGEFASGFANFEWRHRAVALVRPGKPDLTLDVEAVDLGRKVDGSIWTLTAKVTLAHSD